MFFLNFHSQAAHRDDWLALIFELNQLADFFFYTMDNQNNNSLAIITIHLLSFQSKKYNMFFHIFFLIKSIKNNSQFPFLKSISVNLHICNVLSLKSNSVKSSHFFLVNKFIQLGFRFTRL